MLKEALCGNYVNFGVFRLYGDNALDKALNMFVKLLVSIPLKILLVSHPVLSISYVFSWLVQLASKWINSSPFVLESYLSLNL